ncbi:MAG: SPOR domain-containing protein [Campylobacterales bacterium]|nr:SPOR domain-containing protein [Campylobacterales bacterium]
MKDHNNLDDLIIDSMEKRSKNNIKSILTTIILIIIVLILAIFSTKILLEEPSKTPLINEQNYTQTANLDLQLDTNATNDENISSTPINMPTDANTTSDTQVETINSKPADIPEIINKKLQTTTTVSPKATKPLENKEVNKTMVKPTKEANKSVSEQKKAGIEVKKEVFFIQVGSFSSKPNETFLSVIKNSKYNYQVKTSKQGETTISKFLIGPFENRAEAEKELKEIKNRINPSAFIIKQ